MSLTRAETVQPGLSRGDGGKFSFSARRLGAPSLKNTEKMCSRWLLSDLKYALNQLSHPTGELNTLPQTPLVGWWGRHLSPYLLPSLLTHWASRILRDIRPKKIYKNARIFMTFARKIPEFCMIISTLGGKGKTWPYAPRILRLCANSTGRSLEASTQWSRFFISNRFSSGGT